MKHRFPGFELIVLLMMGIVAVFLYPVFFPQRPHLCETSGLGTMRTFLSAQATYMNRNNVYGTLKQLLDEGLIHNQLYEGKYAGYFIGTLPTGSNYAYTFCAMPIEEGLKYNNQKLTKEYCITQEGKVYEADFDSSGKILNINGGDTDWSNPAFKIPPQFVIDPKTLPKVWKPIN